MLIFKFGFSTPAVDYRYPRILMYHMVCEHKQGAKFNKLRVTPKHFEEQISWLVENGWTFVTMAEIASGVWLSQEKCVAITFDDGYEDNYTNALPILKQHQAKGTLYLVVNRHDNDWSVQKKAHHDSGELMREAKLSDQQVQDMVKSGCIELGGHTTNHINFATTSKEQKSKEVTESKQFLESRFATKVTSFAYPFGILTEEDPALIEQAGYDNAVLAEGGIETSPETNRFKIRRIKISGKDSLRTFKRKIAAGKK